VIPGLDEGVSQLSIGERAKILIPSEMAYAERGFPGLIPRRVRRSSPYCRAHVAIAAVIRGRGERGESEGRAREAAARRTAVARRAMAAARCALVPLGSRVVWSCCPLVRVASRLRWECRI
jgi:hypothetical protein